jgi:tripartite-type tricarboxylate transporter receptor subunit TctC
MDTPVSAGRRDHLVARMVGAKVSESIGQKVIKDNRPGAAAIIARRLVKRAPAEWLHAALRHAGLHGQEPRRHSSRR